MAPLEGIEPLAPWAAPASGRAVVAEVGQHGRSPVPGSPRGRPKRGRKRTPETITERLAAIDERLATADTVGKLQFVQQRMDLQRELTVADGNGSDLEELQAAFVEVVPIEA